MGENLENLPEQDPKKKRGRPRKSPEEKAKKAREKKLKDYTKANRDTDRYIIEAITNKGEKMYYLDDIVVWCYDRRKSMQIYGQKYAEQYARKILARRIQISGHRKIVEINVRPVVKKYLDPSCYIEEVLDDDKYFRIAFSIKQKDSERRRKKNRQKALASGKKQPKTEEDFKFLERRKQTHVRSQEYLRAKTEAKRDRHFKPQYKREI